MPYQLRPISYTISQKIHKEIIKIVFYLQYLLNIHDIDGHLEPLIYILVFPFQFIVGCLKLEIPLFSSFCLLKESFGNFFIQELIVFAFRRQRCRWCNWMMLFAECIRRSRHWSLEYLDRDRRIHILYSSHQSRKRLGE